MHHRCRQLPALPLHAPACSALQQLVIVSPLPVCTAQRCLWVTGREAAAALQELAHMEAFLQRIPEEVLARAAAK